MAMEWLMCRRLIQVVRAGALLFAISASGCLAHNGDSDLAPSPGVVPAPAAVLRGPIAGSASCAGRSCHGGLEPTARDSYVLLNEYTTVVTTDPHARGYRTLLDAPSMEIAHRLGIAEPHHSERCLACHVTPEAASVRHEPEVAGLLDAERQIGVGCESCHGNAMRWLDAHVSKDWRAMTAKQKDARGMVEVRDAAELARRCAGCHVGAPPTSAVPLERDVNHDLIAAGHPRLVFEFSSYFNNLPEHWKPRKLAEVPRRAVGQVIAAEAALDLLKHRAASPHAPWPEFAEYDCFACHHSLSEPTWRQARAGRRPGSLTWGTWYFTVPRTLAVQPLAELEELTREMEKSRPGRDAVSGHGEKALVQMAKLRAAVSQLPDTPASARQQMKLLVNSERARQESSWDAAEQTYLALWTLNRTAQDRTWQTRLNALLDARSFRPGWDGPRLHLGEAFDPQAFFKALRAID
jgi:hypothetical protein